MKTKIIITTIAVFLILSLLVIITNRNKTRGDLQMISANPEKGFNFPYYLFLPEEGLNGDQVFFIVEPNNTGSPTDDFDKHIDAAKQQAKRSQIGNYLSHKLRLPLLVPVFPRPENNWKIYTHALDRDAMVQKSNSIERLDLQLIAMFEDAKIRLAQLGHKVEDKFIICGFSACGTFTNRFSAIHPQKVKASVAGGLNGILILPTANIGSRPMPYPIGISDLKDLTGHKFDSVSFGKVPQFLFMGEIDDNDAAPYEDAYDNSEREIIHNFLGKQMLPDRWNYCRDYYQKKNINAKVRTYPKTGHEITDEIQEDILSFIKTSIYNKLK
jgi:predicted esterase